jgi:hypothetical protein
MKKTVLIHKRRQGDITKNNVKQIGCEMDLSFSQGVVKRRAF